MSSTDYVDTLPGAATTESVEQQAREWIQQAKNARRGLEPTWLSNLAFAAGKHWLKWNTDARRLEFPRGLAGKELYTADVISEYRMTALGDLATEDDRPELLLVSEGDEWDEEFQKALNRAVGHGWDHEWDGDSVLAEVDRLCIDLGTAAVQCQWDPDSGGQRKAPDGSPLQVPYQNGKPELDAGRARAYVADTAAAGGRADIRSLHEGKIRWIPLSAFNLLPPPGVPNERDFPWEFVVRPTLLEQVQDMYPHAKGMSEDGDIGSVLGTSHDMASADLGSDSSSGGSGEKLRGHVWLYTGYQRPSRKNPNGRTIVLAGGDKRLLQVENRLPYVSPDGTPTSGIVYFHWQRVVGRFFSRSLVEALKDPQRRINRRITQSVEIIDRGMPFVLVEEDSIVSKRHGVPLEKVELKKTANPPVINQGVGPGAWMQADIEAAREDLEHASGFKGISLGENPTNVNTYGQLALINEKEAVKRQTIGQGRRLSISRLVELSVHDIRAYWGSSRKILFEGDEDARVEGAVFDATKIPPFFIVKTAKGASQPRGQGAQLKMVEDIWLASVNSQQLLPLDWLKESYEAGQPMDLPDDPGNDQRDKAELENHVMAQTGEPLHVAYYDPLQVHLPEHRAAQIQAEIAGDMRTWKAIEIHVQQHLQAQAVNAQQVADSGPQGDVPPEPGAAGSPVPPAPKPPPAGAPGATATPPSGP